jgi:hypothetical protein
MFQSLLNGWLNFPTNHSFATVLDEECRVTHCIYGSVHIGKSQCIHKYRGTLFPSQRTRVTGMWQRAISMAFFYFRVTSLCTGKGIPILLYSSFSRPTAIFVSQGCPTCLPVRFGRIFYELVSILRFYDVPITFMRTNDCKIRYFRMLSSYTKEV